MNRRAFSLALLLAGAATLLLLLYMQRFEQEMSGGEPVEVLMAIKPIERGTVLTDDMLATRSVPIAYVEDRAIKAAERSKIIGLEAANTIQPQQMLMWMDLAITTEERDLSSLVQPGKRGFTVRATTGDDTRGNALIRPGDYVDVIVTMAGDQLGEQTSVVLLQRILVLAVGYDTQNKAAAAANKARDNYGAQSEKVLTLELESPGEPAPGAGAREGAAVGRDPQRQRPAHRHEHSRHEGTSAWSIPWRAALYNGHKRALNSITRSRSMDPESTDGKALGPRPDSSRCSCL